MLLGRQLCFSGPRRLGDGESCARQKCCITHRRCCAGCWLIVTVRSCLQDAAQHAGNWSVEVHCLLLRLHKQLLGPPEAPTSDEQHRGTIGPAITVPAAVLESTELQHEVASVAQALSSLQAVASRVLGIGQGAHR